MPEVLIYGQISSYSSELFIRNVNEILEKDASAELTCRINSNGGDVDYAWGTINKFAEYPNKKHVIVDGKAQSMGLYFLVYADDVKAADFANFLLHRASYPYWVESDPVLFTPARKSLLADANKKLRAALEAKIDVNVFKAETGYTLDQVFSMEGVLDVPLTVRQAKRIGLVNTIIQVTPKKKAEIDAQLIEIAAKYNGYEKAAKSEDKPLNKTKMTLAELKAENYALYEEIFKSGVAAGVKAEKSRIQAWAHYADVDIKAVKAGIESGEEISQLQIIELSERKFSKKGVEDLEDDSKKDPLNTKEPEKKDKTAAEKKTADFVNKVAENSSYLSAKG